MQPHSSMVCKNAAGVKMGTPCQGCKTSRSASLVIKATA